MRLALLLLALILAPAVALAQGALLQGGPFSSGHMPMYSGNGQPTLQDSGAANGTLPNGGANGAGLSELLQINRSPTGTGPLGAHNCLYDNPINSAAGYHYLCLDANQQGLGPSIVSGSGGGASPQPLSINGMVWPPSSPAGTVSITQYGGKADNSTDLGAAMQAAYNANAGCVRIPAGIYLISTAVVFNAQAPCFFGDGWNEAVSGTTKTGTWIHITQTNFTPFSITNVTGQGATPGFFNMAFYEDQPADAAGWGPNPYQYIFNLVNNLGRIDFGNLFFYNTTHCINFSASARSRIKVAGMPVGTCLQFDKETDVIYLDDVEFWPFWTPSVNISTYNQSSVDPVVFQRADSPYIGNYFVFGYHSGIELSSSANGHTTGLQGSNLNLDGVQYGVWITGSGSQAQFANVRTAGGTISNTVLPGSLGYFDSSGGSVISIANFDCFVEGSSCVSLTGASTLQLGNPLLWNFNNDNNSSVGLNAGTTGTIMTANQPSVVNPQNGGTVIPPVTAGGVYAVRGTRQDWTPILKGTTTTGTYTPTFSVGRFWYDGSLTVLTFNISVTAFTGFVGNLAIQGLPLPFNMTANDNSFCYVGSHAGVTLDTGYSTMSGSLPGGGGPNQVLLLESGGAVPTQATPISDYAGSFIIEGTCTMGAGQ